MQKIIFFVWKCYLMIKHWFKVPKFVAVFYANGVPAGVTLPAVFLKKWGGTGWKMQFSLKKVTRNGIKGRAKINLSRVRVWLRKWDMSNKLLCFGSLMFLLILNQKNHEQNIKKHKKRKFQKEQFCQILWWEA